MSNSLSEEPTDRFSNRMKKNAPSKKKSRMDKNSRNGQPLDRAEYASFLDNTLANPHGQQYTETNERKFFVTRRMKKQLKVALHNAPKGKATGPDGIFSDMFRITPEISLEIITACATKIGVFGRCPEEWLSDIHSSNIQKGDPSAPKSYRLSACYPIIEENI